MSLLSPLRAKALSLTGCLLSAILGTSLFAVRADAAFPKLALKPISLNQVHSPTTITHAPDGSGRLFVCDQPGIIYVIENGFLQPTPFLDISATAANAADRKVVGVTTGYSERGLLGLTFHPGYADPGSPGYRKFYLNYVKPYVAGVDPGPSQVGDPVNAVTVIAEFQVSEADPNVADPASERRLLLFTQPQSNHNGGQLEFGPEIGPGGERYLYIGTGDGGSQNDNNAGHTGGSASRPTDNLGNSQDKTRLLGKILRINPLGTNGPGGQYGIPIDNPFVGAGGGVREEIYAYGMRNPWRFSFDKRPGGTNRLFCGDVGGDRVEEVDIIVKGGNYGWRYLEGTEMPAFSSGAITNPMPNPGGPFIPPIVQYAHPGQTVGEPPLPQLGLSVTGGFIYRGAAIPALQGKYIFGDYGHTSGASDGRVMGLEETAPGSGVFTFTQNLPLLGGNPIVGQRILTFGEDASGEIYVGLKSTAGVLQLDGNGSPAGGIYQIVSEQRVTATLTPSQDNTIFSDDVALARNYSDARGYLYAGRTGTAFGPYVRRALVAFDVPGRVPSGSVVQSASLQLNLVKSGSSASGKSIELHPLTENWGEGTSENEIGQGYGAPATPYDATWLYRFFNTSTWTTPGGSFSASASATAVVGNPGLVTWNSTAQLVADVQGWVDAPASNAGWLLLGNEAVNNTACQFDSKQSGSIRPKLTVTFDTASSPIVFVVPADITTEATSASGAVVNYAASAADSFGSPLSFTTNHESGSTFPVGTTAVNLFVDDGFGSTASATFMVTVQDTTKPTLTLPGPITGEATSANGATVNFNVSANDAVGVTSLQVTPASGSVFPLGQTTVNVSAKDAAGNEQTGSFTVTVQDTTAPALTLPQPITVEATGPGGAVVTFNVMTSDAVSAPNLQVAPASGSTFAVGQTTVNVTSTDGATNTAMGSFTVTVQDTTPPTIGGNFPSHTTSVTTVADYRSQAVTSDLVGVTSVTQNPAPGSALALGTTTVTVTAHDAAGNEASLNFKLTRYPADPEHTPRHTSGEGVPGAGSPGGAPAGATFMSFGVPAINDAGEIAFLAKWTSPTGTGTGIFVGNPATLVVKTGDPAAEAAPATFKTLTDPVLDAAGHVAFLATLTGAGVAKGTDTVLATNAFTGAIEIAAREGSTVAVPGDPRIKAFREVSLVGDEILFTATLSGGTPAVRGSNNDAAFRIASHGTGPELVVREGDPLDASTVKAFRLLDVVTGSPGQNRGHTTGTASFLALLADRTQALVESTGGTLTSFLATGDTTGGSVLPAVTFKTFGPVATDTTNATFLATLNVDVGGVTAVDSRAVFLGTGTVFDPIAREAGPAGDLTNLMFKSLHDPVLAPGKGSAAFPALLKGSGVKPANDLALFYQPDGGTLRCIAREGEQPPGTPTGTRWKNFVSLALPAGDTGPLFHATLSGSGVKSSNDAGVWAINTAGATALLFREGDVIGDPMDGKILKRFTVLNAVRGSTGVTRAFNQAALVVWRAEFTDHTSAIVVTSVP